ncbi:MAG: FMN-binding glutamate synthase family protein [Nanoarchaeota archaeon]
MNIGLYIIFIILGTIAIVAVIDIFNKKHTIKSNFPVIGRLRYLLEKVGPEMRQYVVANNREEQPFDRVWRSYIYASAKGQNNLTGFGSDADFNKPGHFFIKTAGFPTNINNTINVCAESALPCAKTIGLKRQKPYRPNSVINISAMSYGALGSRATTANNIGARGSSAYHNIGEGGFSGKYHNNGADVVFQIGTGYFGCGYTDKKGFRHFDINKLVELVEENKCIKMIEVKLSQGAKPGKGGILPGKKVTKEIAEIRGLEVGKDVHAPAYHGAFSPDVDSLVSFVEMIAEKTGLPVGIKSAVGKIDFWKDLANCMRRREEGPDFITIDGGEGGTGAAPASFADNMSLPLMDGFASVYKMFFEVDLDLIKKTTFIASGKLGHPSHAVKAFAMGADLINIAREVMISAGCIQAQKCHTGNCPAGIATHKWWLQKGFNVEDKSERVSNFIITLKKDIVQITHAAGYVHPCQFDTKDIVVNTGDSSRKTLQQIYEYQKVSVEVPKLWLPKEVTI